MSDKHLSGEEKRRLLKEQYKKDLMMRKDFLRKAKSLRQMQNINRALEGMTPQDDTDDWINKLNEESAFTEAKLEMAADTAKERQEMQQTEEEMQDIIAKNLVEQMKREMMEEAGIKSTELDHTDITPEEVSSEEGGEVEESGPPRRTFGDREL